MSIPVSIDPLGTLGSSPLDGYVTDGLILAFDALLEKPGTQSYLTNWVSGTKYQLGHGVSILDGVITPSERVNFYGEPADYVDGVYALGADYSAELCAIKDQYMAFSPWFVDGQRKTFQFHNSDAYGVRIPAKPYPLQYFVANGTDVSVYLEQAGGNARVCVNGEAVPLTNAGQTIGDAVGIVDLLKNSRLHAYRLYSRQLSPAEQKQNYAMDVKRFNLT